MCNTIEFYCIGGANVAKLYTEYGDKFYAGVTCDEGVSIEEVRCLAETMLGGDDE